MLRVPSSSHRKRSPSSRESRCSRRRDREAGHIAAGAAEPALRIPPAGNRNHRMADPTSIDLKGTGLESTDRTRIGRRDSDRKESFLAAVEAADTGQMTARFGPEAQSESGEHSGYSQGRPGHLRWR